MDAQRRHKKYTTPLDALKLSVESPLISNASRGLTSGFDVADVLCGAASLVAVEVMTVVVGGAGSGGGGGGSCETGGNAVLEGGMTGGGLDGGTKTDVVTGGGMTLEVVAGGGGGGGMTAVDEGCTIGVELGWTGGAADVG